MYREGYTKSEDFLLIDFPSAYEISFKTFKSANNSSVSTINIYDNDNKGIGIGYFANTYPAEIRYYNGSSWTGRNDITTLQLNADIEWKYIYENGVGTATIGQSSKSYSYLYTATKINWGITSQTNIKIKDLLIKPL